MQLGSLQEIIDQYIHDGQSVALEGFTHLIPFAAGHEILRQKKRDLHLIRMTPDLIYEQLIGAGCARALTFSWGGNPGVGSLHRLRDAVENDWPRRLTIHEHSHAGMAVAYTAGAARLPFGILRGYVGTDLSRVNAQIREVRCPYTNEMIATVPAINPDVTVLHAQAADRQGNILIRGIVGAQKEAALAATTLIVTVEEIIESLAAPMNAIVLTHAPDLVLIYESGAIGTHPNVLPLSIGDGELAETADAVVPLPEIFSYWLQAGRIDVGFLGAAQIDRFGNLNTTVIGDYDKPKTRHAGAGGAPELALHARKIYVVWKHSA